MIFNDDQNMIRDQAERLIQDHISGDLLRDLLDATNHFDRKLWDLSSEMGWAATIVPEEYDGLGLGFAEICIIAEQLGRRAAAIPFSLSSATVVDALVQWGSDDQKQTLLPQLASGEKIGCLGFSEGLDSGIPEKLSTELRDGKISGKKIAVSGAAVANLAIIYVQDMTKGQPVLAVVDLTSPGITRESGEFLDNNRNMANLVFDNAPAQILECTSVESLKRLLDISATVLAFEQVGGSQSCLEMAREYALERQVFGQPIAKFQAIKHNLAEMYSLHQLAKGAAFKAVQSLEHFSEDLAQAAAAARIAAIKSYDYCSKENIQIHGGIGITWEADCHLHYRRARSLALEVGSRRYWERRCITGLQQPLAEVSDNNASNESPEGQYRQEVRTWLKEHAPKYSPATLRELSEEKRLEKKREWIALRQQHGYAGIALPTEYGGGGKTIIEKMIYEQEELKYETPSHVFHISQSMPVPILLSRATEEQKKTYVPPALKGETLWCQLFSEPAAGSDLAALRLTSRQEGDEWILNGQKMWTSWAQHADYGIIITRSDPTVKKHAGLTYFFVDMKSPGIEVRTIRKLAGESEINEVFFTDVRIPDSNRLGAIGEGFRVAIETLMIERYSASDPAFYGPKISDFIAMAQSATINGKPAIEDGSVQRAIAESFADEQGLRSIQERAFAAMVAGEEPGAEGSITKLVAATKRQRLSSHALDWMGPAAIQVDGQANQRSNAQASWLQVPGGRIAGGTDEILRNTIAEKILGLPQDYRPDKGIPFNQIGG